MRPYLEVKVVKVKKGKKEKSKDFAMYCKYYNDCEYKRIEPFDNEIIEDLQDENIALREVRDELIEENEKLRLGEVLELRKEIRRLKEEIRSREEAQKLKKGR